MDVILSKDQMLFVRSTGIHRISCLIKIHCLICLLILRRGMLFPWRFMSLVNLTVAETTLVWCFLGTTALPLGGRTKLSTPHLQMVSCQYVSETQVNGLTSSGSTRTASLSTSNTISSPNTARSNSPQTRQPSLVAKIQTIPDAICGRQLKPVSKSSGLPMCRLCSRMKQMPRSLVLIRLMLRRFGRRISFLLGLSPNDEYIVETYTDLWQLHEFGKLVLNRNPENFHRDVEQAAFSPGSMVPGIEDIPDPLLQFRMFFYRDAQYHRIG